MIGNSLRFDVIAQLTRAVRRAASRPIRSCGRRSRASSPVSACSGGCASERGARSSRVPGRRSTAPSSSSCGRRPGRHAPSSARAPSARTWPPVPTPTPRTGARSCSPGSAARSAAAPTRCTRTTSANGSSASRPNRESTATNPGARPAWTTTHLIVGLCTEAWMRHQSDGRVVRRVSGRGRATRRGGELRRRWWCCRRGRGGRPSPAAASAAVRGSTR